MKYWYKKLSVAIIPFLLLISTVSADESSSIILDNDTTSVTAGDAYIMLSVMIMVFAAIIIIKILMSRGE